MRALHHLLVRLGPYTASVALTFAVGVLSVPAIIYLAGSAQWANIAIVQSVAAFATVFVGFGWGATGPNQIATLPVIDRSPAFLRSVYARGVLYLFAAPITSVICIALTDLPPVAAVMIALAYSLQGMGGVWFFVGESRPMRVLMFDAVPRAAGIVGGIVGLWITDSIVVFAAVLLFAAVVSQLLSYRAIFRRAGGITGPRLRTISRDLSDQRHGVLTTSAASLYYNSSLIVCSVFAPATLEQFALVFKLYNYAGAALVPVLQMAQAWIPSGGPSQLHRRVRMATLVTLSLAIPIALASVVLLPVAGNLLSLGSIQIPLSLAMPIGICIGTILVNQVVGQASLVAVGKVRSLAWSATVGAVAGVMLQVAGTVVAGGPGLATAVAVTDVAVAAFQTYAVITWLRATQSPDTA